MDNLEQKILDMSRAVVELASRLEQLYGLGGGEVKPQLENLKSALGRLVYQEPENPAPVSVVDTVESPVA